MGNYYAPREFLLKPENVNLGEVTDETLYFVMGGHKRIKAVVSTDPESGVVHAAPMSPLEEGIEYWIMFSKELHFTNGDPFPKDFYIRFVAKDGHFYGTHNSSLPLNDSFFRPEHILSPNLVMVVPFHEPGVEPDIPAEEPPQPKPKADRHVVYVDGPEQKGLTGKLILVLIPLLLLILAVILFFVFRRNGIISSSAAADGASLPGTPCAVEAEIVRPDGDTAAGWVLL